MVDINECESQGRNATQFSVHTNRSTYMTFKQTHQGEEWRILKSEFLGRNATPIFSEHPTKWCLVSRIKRVFVKKMARA